MIQGARYKNPSISFGLGKTTSTVRVNQGVTVWVAQAYNPEVYEIEIEDEDATKISDNQFVLSWVAAGTYSITATVSNKTGSIVKRSNTIHIQVLPL